MNVPTSEATKPGKVFFQEQLNLNELLQSNTTLDYGLGKGFETGINVLGLNFSDKKKSFLHNDSSDTDPFNPLLLINGLKQFKLSEIFSLSSGVQGGVNITQDMPTYESYLIYFNLLIENLMVTESKITGGTYYNSLHYGGSGNRIGGWVAAEFPINNKIHMMAESILGNNALSYSSFGIIIFPKHYLPLTFGFQIPNTSRNSYAFVFELTYVP